MRQSDKNPPALEFRSLSPDTWPDLLKLFVRHGSPGWCWCMLWRVKRTEFTALGPSGRKAALEARVRAGVPTGVLAYTGGAPVGWCSVAPRETYAGLERSKVLARIDNRPVWSVACFFVAAGWKRKGLTTELLKAAARYAFACGAEVVEGYPVEPGKSYQFMGSISAFEKAGFREAGVTVNGRKVMRLEAERV